MTNLYNLISLILLATSIALISNKRTLSYIKTFQIQSFVIIIGALIMAYYNHHIELLLVSLIMFLLKVVYIPRYLRKTRAQVSHHISKDFYLNIPILLFLSFLLIGLAYFGISDIALISESGNITSLTCNISLILIGLLFMVTRKKAIAQIIGFLSIENGLFSTALFTTHGMPFIIDLGIFIDLLTAVIIMSLIVFQIDTKFQTTNTEKLNNLRG